MNVTSPVEAPPTGQPSPYASRWWIASAVLLALTAVALAWLLLSGPPPTRPAVRITRAAPAVVSACGLPGGDQTPPAVTPPTTWRLVGSMAAPYSAATGPARTVDGVGACYAPTPLGALYAAAGFLAATSAPALREPAATDLCAPGPGRDAALAALSSGEVGGTAAGVQVAGFAFTSYTPGASARVELALTTGRGGYAEVPLTLVWSAGTWLVQLPVTGDPFGAIAAVGPGDFVAWSGA